MFRKKSPAVAFAWSGKFCLFRRGTVPAALGWQLGGLGLFRRRLLFRVDEEQVDDFTLG